VGGEQRRQTGRAAAHDHQSKRAVGETHGFILIVAVRQDYAVITAE
jgi:hypothetical protein